MATKVLTKRFKFLVKEHRILKLIFFTFASYLIFEELYAFLVVKPTYTSNQKRNISAEDFPEILLCPEPAINISVANAKGYHGAIQYFFGSDSILGSKQLGWGGNKSEDVKKVSAEISILRQTQTVHRTRGTLIFGSKVTHLLQTQHQ